MLQATPICSRISGFTGGFPLFELGNLFHENWIEEDIVNALCELSYICQYTSQGADQDVAVYSMFLFLPTRFFSDAEYLYNLQPREFGTQL